VVPQYQSGIRVIVVGYDLAPTGHFQYPSLLSSLEQRIKDKNDEMKRGSGRHGEQEICAEFLLGNLIGRDHVGEVDVE
jgi:hypothetical protein